MAFLVTIIVDYLTKILLFVFLGTRGDVDFDHCNTAGVVTCRAIVTLLAISTSTLSFSLIFFRLILTQLRGLIFLYIFGWFFGYGRLLALRIASIDPSYH